MIDALNLRGNYDDIHSLLTHHPGARDWEGKTPPPKSTSNKLKLHLGKRWCSIWKCRPPWNQSIQGGQLQFRVPMAWDSTQSALTPGEISLGKCVMTVWRYRTQSEACERTTQRSLWCQVGSWRVRAIIQVKKKICAASSDHLAYGGGRGGERVKEETLCRQRG